MPRPAVRAVLAVIAAWAVVPNAGARADELLGTEPAPVAISAAAAAFAWSTYDTGAGAWYLVVRRSGITSRVPLAPREVPFDVDLGTSSAGHLVAAYSRCDVEPSPTAPRGHGCDAYSYNLDLGGPELRLPVSTDAASETLPTLSGGRLAFVREHERLPGARGRRAIVGVRTLAGGRTRKLPAGTTNDDARTGPVALDLVGRKLAIAWSAAGPAGPGLPYGAAELLVDDLDTGSSVLVERLARSALTTAAVTSPQLAGRIVRYGVAVTDEGDPRVTATRTLDLRTGGRRAARLPSGLAGVARAGGEMLTEHCEDAACRIVLRGSPELIDPDRVLARSQGATTISAYGGWLAYSVADRAGRYRLALRSPSGTVTTPAVTPRRVPFDVDLGPGPDDAVTAVYSRCATEPRRDPGDGLPLPQTGRGCTVVRLPVAGGGEVPVPAAARAGASQWAPAIWKDRVAFARSAGRGAAEVRIATLDGSAAATIVRGTAARALDLRRATVLAVRGTTVQRLSANRPPRVVGRATGDTHLLAPALSRRGAAWIVAHRDRATTLVRMVRSTGARRWFLLPRLTTAFAATSWRGAERLAFGRPAGSAFALREPATLPERGP